MKKSLMFLLVLTVTMVVIVPAKSYADPQLDILLNIANQARDNLSITISQTNNVPSEINQLYAQGSNETDALAQAVSQQDVNSAKQHFLAAMKYFKQTNEMINSLNATASNDQQKAEINQLQGQIIRLENMGTLLKSIALQNNVDINFTAFDQTLQTASQDINSGNLEDASKQIQNANDFVVATHNSLTAAAQEKISQRAKEFTERQIEQLNSATQPSAPPQNNTNNANNTIPNKPLPSTVRQNITSPTPTPPAVNGSNFTMASNPRDMVAELKTLVAQGKVDQAINLIKIIQAYQKAKLAEKASEMITQTPPPQSTPENNTLPTPPSPQQSPPENNTSPPPPQSTPENNTLPTPPSPQQSPPENNTSPPPPQSTPENNTLPTPPSPQQSPPENNTSPPPPQSTPENNTLPASSNATKPILPMNGTLSISPSNVTLPIPPQSSTDHQPHDNQTSAHQQHNEHVKRHDNTNSERRRGHRGD